MEVAAHVKDVRFSAQKARLVIDQVRGLPVERALDILTFSTKKAAGVIKKALESAIANAENNNGLDLDALFISTAYADEATTHKRFRARARGRSNTILKRGCHITLKVSEKSESH
ncbi:MAG: 50S ribosomal protein L22 [marine bacterium B5-7]|nr:MAG: 50S ribosomal protein L22 [marine bacterium B5-7]